MNIQWIDRSRLGSQPMFGTFLNLGSSLSAEVAASKGFDWLLIDTEHGAGGYETLIRQLQAVAGSTSCPIVRVEWNDAVAIKRTLDAGAAGVMVPFINTAEDAHKAVAAVHYPPEGIRGVAGTTRATGFGAWQGEYREQANKRMLTVVQLETPEAVDNAEAIAAVQQVDVLFIGPLDLSYTLGCPADFQAPEFNAACETIVAACKNAGKSAGILVGPDRLSWAIESGFDFIAVGSDGGCLNLGFDILRAKISELQ